MKKNSALVKIAIVVGEASGDLLGAQLIADLRKVFPAMKVEGVAGPAMMAAGCASLIDIERLSVMGFLEPLLRLPDLFKARQFLFKHFCKNPPDIFIGIDSPAFNIGLELKLKRRGIRTVHYVSPSIWAWRKNRIFKIKKAVDLMLTLLPFEAEIYQQHHVPVQCVGHPLAQQYSIEIDKFAARRLLHISENQQYVGLFPGSRKQEIDLMAETILIAARKIYEKFPSIKFLTSHINAERYAEFYSAWKKYAPELPLEFYTRRSSDVMQAADFLIISSGTATLEGMLCKKPMAIIYKMSKITYSIAKRIVKTPFIGLPNVLAGRLIVPEFIQDGATPEAIASYIINMLENPQEAYAIEQLFQQTHLNLIEQCASPASLIEQCIYPSEQPVN